MRILHVISSLDPKFGGTTAAVSALLKYGPEEYAQEVVTLDDPGAAFLDEITLPVHALGPTRSTYSYSNKLIPWLKANRARFDGVVVHGMWQYTGYAVWRTMRGHVPYVVFPHGMLDPYFKRAFPAKHLKKWLYWLPVEYWVLRGASRVLFTCEAEAELAKQSFWLHRWNALRDAVRDDSSGGRSGAAAGGVLRGVPGGAGKAVSAVPGADRSQKRAAICWSMRL